MPLDEDSDLKVTVDEVVCENMKNDKCVKYSEETISLEKGCADFKADMFESLCPNPGANKTALTAVERLNEQIGNTVLTGKARDAMKRQITAAEERDKEDNKLRDFIAENCLNRCEEITKTFFETSKGCVNTCYCDGIKWDDDEEDSIDMLQRAQMHKVRVPIIT